MKLSLRVRYLVSVCVILLASLLLLGWQSYEQRKKDLYATIDAKLVTAAHSAVLHLRPWHERFTSDHPPTPDEYDALNKEQSLLAQQIGIEYL